MQTIVTLMKWWIKLSYGHCNKLKIYHRFVIRRGIEVGPGQERSF